MPFFRYQALNAKHELIAGRIEAEAVSQAIAQLEAAGLTVQSIGFALASEGPEETGRPHRADDATSRLPRAKPNSEAERSLLKAHLSAVLNQSRVILPALRAYAEEMPSGRRRRQLQAVCAILDSGDAAEASRALADLPEYWIPLLSAAASSQDPGRVLREFLDESQQADEFRNQTFRALIYPAVVLGLAATVLVGFSISVVPTFRDIFNDFDLELPQLTVDFLKLSDWINSGRALTSVLIAAAIIGAIYFGRRFLPSELTTGVADKFGALLGRPTAIAQYSRFVADLLEAGIPVPSALRIAGIASRRPRLQRAGWRLADSLETRVPPLPRSIRPLTATLTHLATTDMPMPARIHMLKELSACYANRAGGLLSWTRGVLEPLAILSVGLVVGLLVLALFVPLVDLVNNLSG